MLFVRSFLFNIFFYAYTAFLVFLFLPTLLLPTKKPVLWGMRLWASTQIRALKLFCNLDVEIRGQENIPAGAKLFAAKHQSTWETVVLPALLFEPAIVLKKELMFIPLYGWYAAKVGMIAVDRGAAAKALKSMVRQAKDRLHEGRSVVIFPEGTRKLPGAEKDYKPGIAALYTQLQLPCVPVALNSGVFWPRHSFLRKPGTIVFEYLPPIEPGLKRREFMEKLESSIEDATDRLISDASES